jgi:predicted GTPase
MYRQMPIYSSNQDDYLKRMQEWHTLMAQHEAQARNFHLDRANQFQKMVEERRAVFTNGTV